ncbi:uncharacterized protein LOC126988564 [Eriocheir sinensis]|uniref:uncharacterized protein LOC126988564 n=1 Tax=Eriocheir sinensis TaxID=95602 RepID=UPI0021C82866|nr:uncharacterized protein LOC126988564 [Eriocheir sinensis]
MRGGLPIFLSLLLLPLFTISLTHAWREEEGEEERGGGGGGGRRREEDHGNYTHSPVGLSWLQEIASTSTSNQPHSRAKRFMGFPEGSFIEAKWSLNFPFDTFTFYKAKLQLGVPIEIPFVDTILVQGDEADITGGGGKRKRRRRRRKVVSGGGENALAEMRLKEARMEKLEIYRHLENTVEMAGLPGRSCILRAICEVAEAPFDQGMLGEMVNTMLTPSKAGRPSMKEEEEEEEEEQLFHQYLEAEVLGRLEGRCGRAYEGCGSSPFDLMPNVMHLVL